MYKTIVTDTSFVQVPVNRTITEQKSPAMKAREAADFILELRTRRFELLTGELEGFPQGEAMQATLDKLDELEASYLTLFTGKTFGATFRRAWFIVPETGRDPSSYSLGMFSEQLGFIPEGLHEGALLEVLLKPMGKTAMAADHYAAKQESTANNLFIYRLPDVVQMEVMYKGEVLSNHRVSVYQSGALVTAPSR